ncbi:hypothetical protein ACQKP0_17315 [Heyndrickxia sp. NPDC080065]|uniref:hypothetical protein n=1 Tax=Heyndrickxia sp. NPDC080065 TaxID=3390568 RepID=UPI003D03BDEF
MDFRQQQMPMQYPGQQPSVGINRRIENIERRLDRIERRFDRLDRRVTQIERSMGTSGYGQIGRYY